MFTKIMQKRKNVLFTVKGRTRTGIKPIAILEKIALNILLHVKFVNIFYLWSEFRMTLERNVNLSKMNNDTWQEAIWLAHRTEAWLLVDFHSILAIFQSMHFSCHLEKMGIFWRIFLAFQELKDGKKNRHFTDSNSATRRIFYEKYIGGRVYVSPFQKFSSPHTSPFESSSSVPTYSRMLFGNKYFFSRTLMGLESVYNSLFTDSF